MMYPNEPMPTAAVCGRGHVAASYVGGQALPKRCEECGAEVLCTCPHCGVALKGTSALVIEWQPADFCWPCGAALPWASRQGIVYAIENMLDGQELTDGDRRQLEEDLASLLETPSESPIEKRQQRALEALRNAVPAIWDRAWPIAAVILTAEVKRQLGLPP